MILRRIKWIPPDAPTLWLFFLTSLLAVNQEGKAQKTTFRYFGHINSYATWDSDFTNPFTSFSLGEHDFFVNSSITDRISFLGETVVTLSRDGSFNANIERARIKYEYHPNHSVILGKMHTPVNYWNDVYHHGRLFYPVIDRPTFFSLFMPIHTLGLRLQGQNIGKANFGYDVVLGNGISSTDFVDDALPKSITAAFHFKPIQNMRIGASYYRDVIKNNRAGKHSGHANHLHFPMNELYPKDITYDILAASFAYFGNKVEVLLEAGYNASTSDSLGRADNFAGFGYLGYRPNISWFDKSNKAIYYIMSDFVHIANNDLHTLSQELLQMGVGIRYDFSYLVNMKVQLERAISNHRDHSHVHPEKWGIRIQVAYGF